MAHVLSRAFAAAEFAVKKTLFDCRGCGQCVLRQTGLICPMSCPKGLRNGPCGGTVGGRCEVDRERPCVWVRIDSARAGADLQASPLFDAPDPALFGSASVINAVTRADRPARTPLPWLDLGRQRAEGSARTGSLLEAALRGGKFAVTGEVRSPRSTDISAVMNQARRLHEAGFAAINTTSFLGGRPALPSGVLAAALQADGIEAIAQTTGRDFTRTAFVGELLALRRGGVRNLLCLTGDAWHGGAPRAIFEMDGGLMLYEARWLAERRTVRFSGDAIADPPRPFLGAAINPSTTPVAVPVRRLLQKAAAGADFIQTQVLTSAAAMAEFMALCRSVGLHRELFILAGIPVVTDRNALERLPSIPGVDADADFMRRLRGATDLRREGVRVAIELGNACAAIPGVHGAHLMLFGRDHDALPEVRRALPTLRPS